MDVLILVSVLLALAVYVARPLYAPPAAGVVDVHRSELDARRDTLIHSLRELEQDRASGLVDREEHARQRASLELEAAAVLRALEASDPAPAD